MISFTERREIEDAYKEWLKSNPDIKDSPFNVITFMCGSDLVKDKTESLFYQKRRKTPRFSHGDIRRKNHTPFTK